MSNKAKVLTALLIGTSIAITCAFVLTNKNIEDFHEELSTTSNKQELLTKTKDKTKELYLAELIERAEETFVRHNPNKANEVDKAIEMIKQSADQDLDATIISLHKEYISMEGVSKPFNDVAPPVNTKEIICCWEGDS